MARPKEFDTDAALDRALEVFWSKGFAATSMQDLVDEMGINRGSLYGTFGDKDRLYARALDRYSHQQGAELLGALEVDEAVQERLRRYLVALVTEPDGRGCFLVNTACERSYESRSSRHAVATAIEATRGLLVDAMGDADASGELRPGVESEVAAETVLTLMQGLQVLTKTGADADSLTPVIDQSLGALFA